MRELKGAIFSMAVSLCTVVLLSTTVYAEDLLLLDDYITLEDDILTENSGSNNSNNNCTRDVTVNKSKNMCPLEDLLIPIYDEPDILNPVAPNNEQNNSNPTNNNNNTNVNKNDTTNKSDAAKNNNNSPKNEATPVIDNKEDNTDNQKSNGSVQVTDQMNRVVDIINKERAKVGAKPLTMNSTLNQVSKARVKEASTYFSHTRPNGKAFVTLYSEYKLSYKYAGENLVCGMNTPELAVKAWMVSPSHKKCMLSNDYSQIGVGVCVNNGITYWVIDLIG